VGALGTVGAGVGRGVVTTGGVVAEVGAGAALVGTGAGAGTVGAVVVPQRPEALASPVHGVTVGEGTGLTVGLPVGKGAGVRTGSCRWRRSIADLRSMRGVTKRGVLTALTACAEGEASAVRARAKVAAESRVAEAAIAVVTVLPCLRRGGVCVMTKGSTSREQR